MYFEDLDVLYQQLQLVVKPLKDWQIIAEANYRIDRTEKHTDVQLIMEKKEDGSYFAMARDDGYNTAGTQFFVVHQDAHKLDGRYAAFGQMVSGFDVLDQIAALPTHGAETWNRPVEMPVMSSVRIE